MSGRDHYQRAFEAYLRQRRLPYVSVDEARRAILPEGAPLKIERRGGHNGHDASGPPATLKSFDFVVYGEGSNLLVEVKGRKVARRRPLPLAGQDPAPVPTRPAKVRKPPTDTLMDLAPPPRTRLESWVTQDDVESLKTWESLFGQGFQAVFAFVYWCEEMAPSALFEEYVERDGRWYAIRCITRSQYEGAMRTRSPRWRTVHVPPEAFERLSRPLSATTGR